jgi:GNAT superfamily N-acetyltransferase
VEIRPTGFGEPDVLRLVEEIQAEYTQRYGGPDDDRVDPAMFLPPRGAFFVGYVDGEPLAMGGWRRRSDVPAFGHTESAEIKRMYVVPRARRTGLARAMLRHLETTAAVAGAQVMVLETGIVQPEAIALYESAGYARIPGFGYYRWSPKSRCFGKPLGVA